MSNGLEMMLSTEVEILQADNARLREENEAYARNLRGNHAITGATYEHLIQERDRLRAELAAAQLEAKAQECERLAEVFEPGWIKNMLDREAAAHRARKQTKEEGK